MRSIYSNAWLGQASGQILFAVSCLNLIGCELELLEPHDDPTKWTQRHPELFQVDADGKTKSKAWNAVDQFLQLPFWSRIWILQEAKRLRMISGDADIDFDSLTLAKAQVAVI